MTLGLFGLWCGQDPAATIRRVESIWSLGPSFHRAEQRFLHPDGSAAVPGATRILHAVTPETDTTTHQFWSVRVDAPLVFDNATLAEQIQQVFAEDLEVLEIQNRNVASDRREGVVVENSIPSDVHGLKFRRVLQRLAQAEAAGPR